MGLHRREEEVGNRSNDGSRGRRGKGSKEEGVDGRGEQSTPVGGG